MMHMTFYWGKQVTLLFDCWKTDSWTSYIITLLACCLFSVFYQYMEDRRLRFKFLSLNRSTKLSSTTPNPTPAFPQSASTEIGAPLLYPKLGAGGRWSPARLAGSVLFGVNSAIGYLLMLAIMSFNAGVFVAVVVGLAVGYLLFRISDEELVVIDNPCACA